MNKGAIRFYKKLKLKHFVPTNICEVGVYIPTESNVLNFITDGIKTILVEADPAYVELINDYFKDRSNVTTINVAIFDKKGTVELCRRASSTFISNLESSPAIVNDNCKVEDTDKFTVETMLFSEIDNGEFDLLSIDIEGAEWYVIKHAVSRPKVISIETHGKYYKNPFYNEIHNWMATNNYVRWYKDASDTVFVKKGVFDITTVEKIQLKLKDLELKLILFKKCFKKK